jgi:hypothetical protein
VSRWQRIPFDLVNVVAAGLGGSNGGLDFIDLGDVDYFVRIGSADAEHGGLEYARADLASTGSHPGWRG